MGPGQTETYPDAGTSPTARRSICIQVILIEHQEEKKDKNIHAQNKQTNVREAQRPATSSPSEVIRMLKQTRNEDKEHEKTLKH